MGAISFLHRLFFPELVPDFAKELPAIPFFDPPFFSRARAAAERVASSCGSENLQPVTITLKDRFHRGWRRSLDRNF